MQVELSDFLPTGLLIAILYFNCTKRINGSGTDSLQDLWCQWVELMLDVEYIPEIILLANGQHWYGELPLHTFPMKWTNESHPWKLNWIVLTDRLQVYSVSVNAMKIIIFLKILRHGNSLIKLVIKLFRKSGYGFFQERNLIFIIFG